MFATVSLWPVAIKGRLAAGTIPSAPSGATPLATPTEATSTFSARAAAVAVDTGKFAGTRFATLDRPTSAAVSTTAPVRVLTDATPAVLIWVLIAAVRPVSSVTAILSAVLRLSASAAMAAVESGRSAGDRFATLPSPTSAAVSTTAPVRPATDCTGAANAASAGVVYWPWGSASSLWAATASMMA